MLDDLSIFLLHVINQIPKCDNQYSIMRFMGKASLLPDMIFGTLHSLVNNEYLEISKAHRGVEYYRVTFKGKMWLRNNYDLKSTSEYANTIDTTGFFSKILLEIENASS